MQRLSPKARAAVEEIAGQNSPVTQAVALGLNGEVNDAAFARLENFYCERNEPVRVETSPLADATLFRHFGASGYTATEFTNVMARAIRSNERIASTNVQVHVSRAAPNELDLWNQTVAQGFAGEQPVSPEILNLMKVFALAEGHECYLARIGNAAVGGGSLALRDGIAGLFGASTLPACRGRGVQSALLAARIDRAAEAGCDLAVCLAQPGSSSQRNIIRQGFGVLYTRVKFERHWNYCLGRSSCRGALMNEVHYGLRRRAWKEDLRDAGLFECGNIRLWNNSADEHRHVVHAFFA